MQMMFKAGSTAMLDSLNLRAVSCGRVKRRKQFFFEKKNQKTFGRLSRTSQQRTPRDKSFLVLFFKKERLSFYLW
jgi:hypothetical protein